MTLGEAFRVVVLEYLEREELTQMWLADKLSLSQPSVSYLINGGRRTMRQHPLDYYQHVASAMGMPLSRLIRELEARVAIATDDAARARRMGEAGQ